MKGLVIVVCPKCGETVKEYITTVHPLSKWAFHYDSSARGDEPRWINTTMDGRMCKNKCFG